MIENKIYDITDSFRLFYSDNDVKDGYSISLEEYRCQTFFTKEPETIQWIDSFGDNETFFDIGANIGQYSIYSAIRNPSLQIYAFEPFRKNYQRICDNIKLNEVDNVIPFLMGLSNSNSVERFYVKDDRISSSGNQLGQSVDERGDHFVPIEVENIITFCVDDFIQLINLSSPNYIKIDVDGVEEKIVDGMNITLNNPELKSVLIEVNKATNVEREGITKIFEKNGFTSKNKFNFNPNHSKYRRKGTLSEIAENTIFTRI
tara:strand:- start:968 stop:1747 length:780 start_codon:yes stop_codon:yes gene_type:complete